MQEQKIRDSYERESKKEITEEQYEGLFKIRLTDLLDQELKDIKNLVFSVSPEFNIFISKKSQL